MPLNYAKKGLIEMGNLLHPSDEAVIKLREEYPPGTRIALVKMNDPQSILKPGDRATVIKVSDAGQLCCSWDNEGTLRLDYFEDEYRKLTSEELAEEQANSEEMTEPEQENGGMEMGM